MVLCAVTAAKSVKPGQDFFPLTVHYQEKFSAAGRIPGGFFKRERGATEKETLTSRLIDRPIRPLFPEGFYNEVLVIAQVLSYDGENEPDILAMIAASTALTHFRRALHGPDRRRPRRLHRWRVHPQPDARRRSPKASSTSSWPAPANAVMMVESEAKELSEEEMLGAVMFGHARAARRSATRSSSSPSRPPRSRGSSPQSDDKAAIKAKLKDLIGKDIEAAYQLTNKSERSAALNAARDKAKDAFADAEPQEQLVAAKVVKSLEADIVRGAILKEGRRIDGRDTKTVRPIEAMVGFLPRTHGSALFTRGETQAIVHHDARHQGSRADDRRSGGPLLPALHAAL